MRSKILFSVVVIAVLSAIAIGQSSSSTAELRGRVTDIDGSILTGSKVTIIDIVKGISRTTFTDAEGNYAFVGLLPSKYEIKIDSQGFVIATNKVELTVGQQAILQFKLSAEQVAESANILDGAEIVDTSRTHQGTTIAARNIVNLPIGRRNYLDYAILTPGVTDSDRIADQSDFRVAQTPQSGLSFGGSNGRGNIISIDGAESIGSSGNAFATLGQEAVQEFQIVRNSYSAEYGGASGGTVDTISKSGGSLFHGSAFGFFRDQSLDAKNVFDFKPDGKSRFNRQQYGGSIGGPLVKQKSFFFSAIERYSKKETTFVNLLRDPDIFNVNIASNNPLVRQQATFFNFINSSTAPADIKAVASGMLNRLTTANFPVSRALFEKSSGQFPFEGEQTMFMARVDHVFNERMTGYVRYFTNLSNEENEAAGALTAVSRGRSQVVNYNGVVASHNSHFGNSVFNELKFQYAKQSLDTRPNEQFGPEINIAGYGLFNRDIFLPARTGETHYDIYENITKFAGSHTLKFGGSFWLWEVDTNSQTFLGGRFNFGDAIPQSILLQAVPGGGGAALNSYLLSTPNPYNSDINGNGTADIFDMPMTSLQSYNLDLPVSYQQGFGDGRSNSYTARTGLYFQDTWRAYQNFTFNYGVRYQINDDPFLVKTQYNNVQPRIGFSWDPFGEGSTVIRGGGGIYTGLVNHAVPNVTSKLAGSGTPGDINIVLANVTSGAVGVPSSITIYKALKAAGVLGTRQTTATDLAALGIIAGPNRPLEVRFRLDDDYQNPATYQASLGIQREFGKGISLETSYMFSRGIHLTRNRDINQFKRTGPVNPLNPQGGATFIRFPTAAQAAAGLTSDFLNPLRFQDNRYESTADSFYHAFTAAVTRRFVRRVGLNAHYTFSKAIDEVTDYNSDFSAQNPLCLDCDRSLSAFDQRHRFVINSEIESPFNNILVKNWQLVPIVIASSGRPFNLLLGFDANGDGRFQSDRPGQSGRNTGLGEYYLSVDMRLARGFVFKESKKLDVIVEGFNLFNKVNMEGINNEVGTSLLGITESRLRGRNDNAPTEPLGFTSAADARKLQLGLRFTF